MRKLRLLFLLVLFYTTTSPAATKQIKLVFNKNQFSFNFSDSNVLNISVTDCNLTYSFNDNTSEPGLPILSLDIKMPKGHSFRSVTQTSDKSLVFDDVLINTNPTPIPTSLNISANNSTIPHYIKAQYPSSNIKYTTTTTTEDSLVFHFQVCPFEYDALNKRLYLIHHLNININTSEERKNVASKQTDFLKFCNAENINFDNIVSTQSSTPNSNDSIDYLIITSNEFSYYFNSFVQWKRTKGVRTKVATIEDIYKADGNSGRSLQDKIKAYILYMYHIKGYKFKYLLLGGDASVVPAKMCYGKVQYTKYNSNYNRTDTIRYLDKIPADIFYACLDYTKDPFWDNSRNGVSGELEDSISLSQDIYVTRLPVRTSTELKDVLMKIQLYERNPSENGWNNSILMSGMKLGSIENSHSDAELAGNDLYDYFINRYWAGDRKRLYDTFSDFTSEGITSLTKDNLQKAMSKGFAYIDVITHGNDTIWSMPGSPYKHTDAQNLQYSQYSVITTTACHTNAFDRSNPCLSKAFIVNPYAGVIAYLGSSRYGWYYREQPTLGPSLMYEKAFYKYLFSNTLEDKNFGKIVAYAKNYLLGKCNKYNAERWLQFSLNPIGDAEMPLYTTTPKTFGNCVISRTNGQLYINTGIDSCNVCVMSSADYGKTFYKVFKNVSIVKLDDTNSDLTICVTKQNYKPLVHNISQKSTIITGKITSGAIIRNTGELIINAHIEGDAQSAHITISNMNGEKEGTYKLAIDEPSITEDASKLKNGVHIISLFINNKLTDSMQIMK